MATWNSITGKISSVHIERDDESIDISFIVNDDAHTVYISTRQACTVCSSVRLFRSRDFDETETFDKVTFASSNYEQERSTGFLTLTFTGTTSEELTITFHKYDECGQKLYGFLTNQTETLDLSVDL